MLGFDRLMKCFVGKDSPCAVLVLFSFLLFHSRPSNRLKPVCILMNDEKIPLTAERAGIEHDVLLYVTVTICCRALNITPGFYIHISAMGL